MRTRIRKTESFVEVISAWPLTLSQLKILSRSRGSISQTRTRLAMWLGVWDKTREVEMAWNRPHFPFPSFMGGGSIILSKPEQERKEGRP